VIAANKHQYYRASSVAWQILDVFNMALDKMATITEQKCVGNHKEAIAAIDDMMLALSEKEIYIERWYDHYLFCRAWERLTEGMRAKFTDDNIVT